MANSANMNRQESEAARKRAGLLLKKWRQNAGLTQRELAPMVDQAYYTFISQVEGGATRVPPRDYKLWAKALGLDAKDMVTQLLEHYDPYTYKILFK